MHLYTHISESIKRYDADERNEKETVTSFTAIVATDAIILQEDIGQIKDRVKQSLSKFATLAVRSDARQIAEDLIEKLDSGNLTSDSLQFLLPILPTVTSDFIHFMPSETVVVFDECKMLADGMSAIIKEHTERTLTLSRSGKAFDFTIKQLSSSEELLKT